MELSRNITLFIDRHRSLLVFLGMIVLVQAGILIGVYLNTARFRQVDEACRQGGTELRVNRVKLFSKSPTVYTPICIVPE